MNRRTKKLVVVIAIAGALALSAGGAVVVREFLRERRAIAGLSEGKAAFEAGDYESAMRGLGVYVGRHKGDSEAMLLLAKARLNVPQENYRHLATAATIAKQAVELTPRNKDGLEMLVDIYLRMGFQTEARLYAERLLEVDPANANAHIAITSVLASSSNWTEATKAAAAFVKACPNDVRAHGMSLEIMALSGVSSTVVKEQALALLVAHPESLAFHVLAAKAVRAADSIRDSTAFNQITLKATTLPVSTAEELSEVLSLLEVMQDADDQVTAYLSRFADHPTLGTLARDLRAERDWKAGRAAAAAAQVRSSLENPKKASARSLMLATLAMDAPEDKSLVDSAIAQLSARQADDDQYWVLVAQGAKAQREGRIAEAREKLAQAAKGDPRPGFAQFLLADLLYPMGEQAEAIRLLESVAGSGRIAGDPSWRVARSRLVSMQVQSGRMADAGVAASMAFGLKPALAEVLGIGYAKLSGLEAGVVQPTEVKSFIDVVQTLDKSVLSEPNIIGLRAWASLALGDSRGAAPQLDELLKADPAPFLEISLRVLALSRDTLPAKHDALLKRFRELAPREISLLGYHAAVLAGSGDAPAAKSLIDEASEGVPESEQFRYELVLASAIEQTDPQGAIALYEKILSRPDAPLAAYLAIADSGAAWSNQNLITRAIAGLRDPLGSNSARLQTLDARRRMTFDRSDKTASEVVFLLTKVLEADRRNIYAATIAAEAYVELDNRAAAIDTISRTLVETRSPVLYPRLISLLQASGRGQDAGDRLRQFLTFGHLPDELIRERARLLAVQGMFAEAKTDLDRLGDRRNSDDYLLTANVLSRRGDASGAMAAIEAARALNPQSMEAAIGAAELEGRAGRYQQGLDILAGLPDSVSPAERNRVIAAYIDSFGDPAQAEAALRGNVATGGAPAWGELAQFYLRRGDQDKAMDAIDQGLKLAPQDSRLNWLKGSVLLSSNDANIEQSIEALSRGAGDENASPVTKEVVEVFRTLSKNPNNWAVAAKSLRDITRKHPTEVDVCALLVQALLNAGDPQGAVSEALKAREAVPADPKGARLAARTLAAVGRFDEALVAGRGWKALASSSDPEPDFFLANIHLSQRQPNEALALLTRYRQAIESGSEKNPQYILLMASSVARAGQIQAAQDMLRNLLQADGELLGVCIEASKSMHASPESARAWLAELSPPAAASPVAQFALANAKYQLAVSGGSKEDLVAAAVDAEKAALDPKFEAASKRLAASARTMAGDTTAAMSLYRESLAKEPEDPTSLNNLAMLVLGSGNPAEAVALSQRAVDAAGKRNDPPQARSSYYDTLGLCLAAADKAPEAEKAFTESSSLNAGYPDPLIGLVELYIKTNRVEDARKTLQKLEALPSVKSGLDPQTSQRLNAARSGVPKN